MKRNDIATSAVGVTPGGEQGCSPKVCTWDTETVRPLLRVQVATPECGSSSPFHKPSTHVSQVSLQKQSWILEGTVGEKNGLMSLILLLANCSQGLPHKRWAESLSSQVRPRKEASHAEEQVDL
jgi:hypothetical protein